MLPYLSVLKLLQPWSSFSVLTITSEYSNTGFIFISSGIPTFVRMQLIVYAVVPAFDGLRITFAAK